VCRAEVRGRRREVEGEYSWIENKHEKDGLRTDNSRGVQKVLRGGSHIALRTNDAYLERKKGDNSGIFWCVLPFFSTQNTRCEMVFWLFFDGKTMGGYYCSGRFATFDENESKYERKITTPDENNLNRKTSLRR
jgi:hypothetical protein